MASFRLVAMSPSVNPPVLSAAHNHEVLGTVIRLFAVDVVDVLGWVKESAKNLLHDVAVFADVALVRTGLRVSRHIEHDVPEVVDVAAFAARHPNAVVTAEELPRAAMPDGRFVSTSARAQKRISVQASVVSPDELRSLVLTALAVGERFAAPARAYLGRHMAAQVVRRSVAEQLVIGDLAPAAAGTISRHTDIVHQCLCKE